MGTDYKIFISGENIQPGFPQIALDPYYVKVTAGGNVTEELLVLMKDSALYITLWALLLALV